MAVVNNRKARILLIDIETSPILGWAWTTFDTNILKIVEHSKVLSVAWKWFGEKKVDVSSIYDYKSYKAGVVDDKALIKDVWKLLDEADIIVAHNGASFDIKKLNSRFIFHKLPLPSSFDMIDTLKEAKKHFKFDQNSLDSLGEYLDEGRKAHTGGFGLWTECMAGNPLAWKKMKDYNAQDVQLLEKIYLRFRPYMEHPNLNVITDNLTELACPACTSKSVQKRGFSYTKAGQKQRYQCSDCGSWSTGPWKAVKAALTNAR